MTQVLKIEDENGSVSVNLISGTLTIGEESEWRSTPMGNGLVEENMTLVAKGTASNIVTAMDTLDDLRGQVEMWLADDYENNCVWFYHQSDGDSEKKSLIYAIETFVLNENKTSSLLGNTGIKVHLSFVRNAEFETSSRGTNNPASSFTWANAHQTINSITGNKPARIAEVEVLPTSGPADGMNEFYIGMRRIRTMQNGIPEEPYIDAHGDGTIWASADTSKSTSATGYTGTGHMRTTFLTHTEMYPRFYWYFSDWITTAANRQVQDWSGPWHVLCRYSSDDSGSYKQRIRLRVDFPSGATDNAVFTRPQVIPRSRWESEPNWDIVDMGTIHIPPWGISPDVDDTVYLDNMRFTFYAEKLTSSAGTGMDIDGFMLVPSEYFLHVDGVYADCDSSGEFHMIENADGSVAVYSTDSSAIATSGGKVTRQNWMMPPGSVDVVVVGLTDTNNHYPTMAMGVNFYTNKRWFNWIG